MTTTYIYTLSLHDALPIWMGEIDDYMNWFEATQMTTGSGNFTGYLKAVDQSQVPAPRRHDPLSVYVDALEDRKSTRLNSSHLGISYAVFCLKKKKNLQLQY